MGELTANKAKAFYMRMRKELIIIKGNYEASGNGFGSAPSEGSSNDFVGDDRKIFFLFIHQQFSICGKSLKSMPLLEI